MACFFLSETILMMKDPMMTFLKVLGQETPAPVAFDEGRTLDLGLLGGQVVVSQ